MRGPWKMLATLGAVGAVAGASIAAAAPNGSSSSKSSSKSASRSNGDGWRRGPGPRGDLTALAKQLDVTTARLRSAFGAVRDELRPPSRRPPQPPTRQQMEARCTALTDALGKELGKSGDDVRSALEQVAKDRLAAAIKAGRLTSDQADEIRQRIDSSDCAPIGPGGPGFGGCRGGGGPGHGPGDPAPGGNRNGSDDSGTSGPPAVPQTTAI